MEVPDEGQGQHGGQHHHQHLRGDGEDERVLERGLELRRPQDAGEVTETDEVEGSVPHRHVDERVEDREHEGHADDEDDVEHGGADHQGPEPAGAVEHETQAPRSGRRQPVAHTSLAAVRSRVPGSKNFISFSGTANSYRRPAWTGAVTVDGRRARTLAPGNLPSSTP